MSKPIYWDFTFQTMELDDKGRHTGKYVTVTVPGELLMLTWRTRSARIRTADYGTRDVTAPQALLDALATAVREITV